MYKLTVALGIVALIGANLNALADGNVPLVTQSAQSRPGNPSIVELRGVRYSMLVPRDKTADAGLTTIAGNFTKYQNSPYWGWTGYPVIGLQAQGGATEEWLATAFTPKANHIVTRVEVPAEYYSGTNGVVLSIYDDASGLPGKSLHHWDLTNLPASACCAVAGGSDKAGIPLTGGKQYWIVLSTDTKDAKSVAMWGLTEFANVQKHGGNWAVYCAGVGCSNAGYKDQAWNAVGPMIYGLAFSVMGK